VNGTAMTQILASTGVSEQAKLAGLQAAASTPANSATLETRFLTNDFNLLSLI
jgi:hypothetical protein